MKKLGILLLFVTTCLQPSQWETLHEHTGPCHSIVFAPHPDDDVIGCGGTIVKRIAQGKQVVVVYMTSGEAGMSVPSSSAQRATKREREARKAARHLGVHKLRFLRFPDGGLSMHRTYLNMVRSIIDDLCPEFVYTPHDADGHSDHSMTCRLVAEALVNLQDAPRHLKYEVWTPLLEVDHLEDVSGVMKQKLEALRLHDSQVSLIPYHEAIEGLNKYRGIMDGAVAGMPCAYAEAFGK